MTENHLQAADIMLEAVPFLLWQEWDDGCVVFNRLTGETHMFDLTSSYLLRLIEAAPRPGRALAAQMARDLEQPDDDAHLMRVVRLLHNFMAMGIIEPAGG